MSAHPMLRVTVSMALIAALLGTTRARADIIDDILSVSTAARDRATEARNRATEARNRATEARNAAEELRDNARLGLAALTTQIRTTISEAVEDMQQMVERELEGRDAFITDGGCSQAVCAPFRQDLVTFLQDIQAITNLTLAILEAEELQINFDRQIDIINLIPGRALYPLYRVLAAEGNLLGPELLNRMSATRDDLAVLKEALQEPAVRASAAAGDAPTPLESEVAGCTFVMNNYDRISAAKKAVSLHGVMFKVMGKRLSATGETTATGTNPGIAGYINVTIKDNKVKSTGEILDGVSEALSKIADFADDKLRDCVTFSALLKAQQKQQDILDAVTAKGADLDGDGDIDLVDYSFFQSAFGAAGGP
jgi:hypothetical protein